MKEEVRRFFMNRFSEPEQGRLDLNGIRFHGIGQQQNDMLVGSFREGEIRAVVWDCESEKSPRPDGLNFKFIK